MPAVNHLADLVDSTIRRLAKTYEDLPAALRDAHPHLVKVALKRAGGDARRLTVEPDGSIIIWNQPVW